MSSERSNIFSNFFRYLRRGRSLDTIRKQGSHGRKVIVKYKKDNGTVVRRKVSPYEIKPHRTSGRQMLYVTDKKGGSTQIKSYALENIQDAEPAPNKFKPNWDVQFGKPTSSSYRKTLGPFRRKKKKESK